MPAIVISAAVAIAIITFMVWGDGGPLWKNWLSQLGVILAILAVGGTIVWVSTYGN